MKSNLIHTISFVIVLTLCHCSSGSSDAVNVERGPSSSNAVAGTDLSNLSMSFVETSSSRPLANEVTGLVGDSVNIGILINSAQSNANLADFSIGYEKKSPQVALSATQFSLQSPGRGNYEVSLVARNRTKCQKLGLSNCEISGRQIQEFRPITDISGAMLVKIVDNLPNHNSGEVGQGGGIIGQVIRGEGLIGTLAKQFMGDGLLGGGLGGTPGQGQTGGASTGTSNGATQ